MPVRHCPGVDAEGCTTELYGADRALCARCTRDREIDSHIPEMFALQKPPMEAVCMLCGWTVTALQRTEWRAAVGTLHCPHQVCGGRLLFNDRPDITGMGNMPTTLVVVHRSQTAPKRLGTAW